MRIAVILTNDIAGELDRKVVTVRNDEDIINDRIHDVIEGWLLGVGDSVTTEEVRSKK